VKRLIYLAYFFPPTGGAGVQRSVKFVRYLPGHDWQPTVVTVRESHYWMQDESLTDDVPESVDVVRTRSWSGPALLGRFLLRRGGGETNVRRSGRIQRSLREVSNWIALPDSYVGWVPFAAHAASRALRDGGVLLTTSSPDSAHLVGLLCARGRVPWVADFRDPWVRRMSFAPPTGWHRRAQGALERAVVANASRIVVTSEATRLDFLSRYRFLDAERIVSIPNGFDEDDFPTEDPPLSSQFELLHLGQLNPERPIHSLLYHLEEFLEIRPKARPLTRLSLIGPRYLEDEKEVARRRLGDVVRFEDVLPHRMAIDRLLRAQVLILLEQESQRGGLVLPGKTFEYLRSGRPILGLLPRGAAWDLITRLEAGFCALPSTPDAGAGYLAAQFDAYCKGGVASTATPREAVARFERRAVTRQLAALLDGLDQGFSQV